MICDCLKTWPACLLALVLLIRPASVLADTDAGFRQLERFLDDVSTLSARFEQQLIDVDDSIVEESSGTLDILRPGRFRWTYSEPYEQIIVADGRNIWSYDVELEQVTVKDQVQTLGSTPATLLGGSRDVLEQFDYLGSSEDRGTTWVRLEPKDMEQGFSKIELGFTNDELSRMLFVDNLEQTTLIALFDVRTNDDVSYGTVGSPSPFEFAPPAGVDVVGTPIPFDSMSSNEHDAGQ